MNKINLYKKYPPSKPCSCEVCLSYCKRPGRWTVKEAAKAIQTGCMTEYLFNINKTDVVKLLKHNLNASN